MSFESPPQSVCLLVTYYGAKALQYSAAALNRDKYVALFRQDLQTMRFPLPKTVNIRLVPGATVMAWWPDVSRETHGVLYNHLINNTNSAYGDGHFFRLSISIMFVKEIRADGTTVQLASAPQFNPSPLQGLLPPPKRARLESFISVPRESQSGPPAPAPQSGPLPSSNTPTPYIAPQRTTGTNPTAQKRTWDGQIVQSGPSLKPPTSSGAPLPQQTHGSSSSRLPPPSVPAAAASLQQTHNLPPKPVAAPPPLAQNASVSALNSQGTAANRPGSNASAVPAASVGPAPPAQASRLPTTQNRQPTQSSITPPRAPRYLLRQLPRSTTERSAAVAEGTSPGHPAPSVPGVSTTQPASTAQNVPTAKPAIPTAQPVPPRPPASHANAPESQTTHNRLSSSTSTATPAWRPIRSRRESSPAQQQSRTFLTLKNQGSDDTELEALRKRVKSMEEMLRTQMNVKVRLDETANKLQEEQEERKKLAEMLFAARESEAGAKRRLHEVQRLFEEESRRHSEADDLLATTRREVLSYRESRDKAERERDEVAGGYDRVREELTRSRRDEDAIQHELGRVVQKLEQTEQELQEETDRRRRYQDRLASAESSEAALRQRYDEAKQEVLSLTSMRDRDAHDARAAKRRDEEALRRCEEKLRTQQIVMRQAEAAIQAAQSSEKALRSRLEEVESRLEEVESGLEAELETERRLRREAEDAIADIRRECKEPFVVPSLLDAFVELAKLTTAATTLAVGEKNDKPGDTPPTTDSAMDAASSNASTVASTTNRMGSPLFLSPQRTPVSAHPSPHTPRLNTPSSPDVLCHMESPDSQIKLESV